MKKLLLKCIVLCVCLSLNALIASAQAKKPQATKADQSGHIMLKSADLKWTEGPNSLPPGLKVAAMEGDMTKAGPFTIRVIMPPNYKIPPHWHPQIEHVTVLEGDFYMGHSDKYDESKEAMLPVGSFAVMPIKFHHYAYTKDKQAVIQLHGIGPWGITYLDPNDDPRKKKK